MHALKIVLLVIFPLSALVGVTSAGYRVKTSERIANAAFACIYVLLTVWVALVLP